MKHIIRLSIKELINKKILSIGIALSLGYLLLYGVGAFYLARESGIYDTQGIYAQQLGFQYMSLGWYVSTFITGSLAVLVGSGSISAEIENGTILELASSPISRMEIVLGKYSAYALMTGLYCAGLVLAVTWISAHFFRLNLVSGAVFQGTALFMLFPLVLLAVSYYASTLFSTLSAGIGVFMLFAVGIIGGFIEQMGVFTGNDSLMNVGIVSSLIMPADAVYRMAVSLASNGYVGQGLLVDLSPFGASSVPSPAMMIYTLTYTAVFLILAVRRMNSMDL